MPSSDNEPRRWWYCTECHAINDGLVQARCWNCDHYERKRKYFPWVAMGHKKCDVCKKSYVTWTLPPNTELRGEPYTLGLCMDYFDHYGESAYYPPMLPLEYVLEANGWVYNEKTKKVSKQRKARA